MKMLSLFKGEIEVPDPSSTMRSIVYDVAKRHGITPEDIVGHDRSHRFTHPRQEAMWLMREVRLSDGRQRWSLPRIAAHLGNRDHTTVLHGVRAHQKRLEAANG